MDDFQKFSKDSRAHFIEIGSSPLPKIQKNHSHKFDKEISCLIEADRFLILKHDDSIFIFHDISEEEGNR